MYDTEDRDPFKCECGHGAARHLPGLGGCAIRYKATDKICDCTLTEAEVLRKLLEAQIGDPVHCDACAHWHPYYYDSCRADWGRCAKGVNSGPNAWNQEDGTPSSAYWFWCIHWSPKTPQETQ